MLDYSAPPLSPVAKKRLSDDISLQLQRKIISGEFPEGMKLPPERDLARQLGVNRTTIREAIRDLEQMGLLQVRQGDGIYVKDYLESDNLRILWLMLHGEKGLNGKALGDILQIRRIICPEMAAEAALRRTDGMLLNLKEIVENGDRPLVETDIAVHSLIARASDNVFYIFAINFFNPVFRLHADLYFNDPVNQKASRKFHGDIYRALAKRDAAGARRIMRDVIVYGEEKTLEALGRIQPAPR